MSREYGVRGQMKQQCEFFLRQAADGSIEWCGVADGIENTIARISQRTGRLNLLALSDLFVEASGLVVDEVGYLEISE